MPSCLASSAVHGKYQVCLPTCHQVPCQQVDPSGPLATLRGLLLSDESLANLQRWIVQHWYAVLFVVLAVMVLLVSLASPVYHYAFFLPLITFVFLASVLLLICCTSSLILYLSLGLIFSFLIHVSSASHHFHLVSSLLFLLLLLSHSLFPSGSSHDGTLQWCLLIL